MDDGTNGVGKSLRLVKSFTIILPLVYKGRTYNVGGDMCSVCPTVACGPQAEPDNVPTPKSACLDGSITSQPAEDLRRHE